MSRRATLGSDSGGLFSDIRLQVGRGELLDFDIANRASIFVMSEKTGKAPRCNMDEGGIHIRLGLEPKPPCGWLRLVGLPCSQTTTPRPPSAGPPLPKTDPSHRARRGKRKKAGAKPLLGGAVTQRIKPSKR